MQSDKSFSRYEKMYFNNPNGKSLHYLSYIPEEAGVKKMPLLVFLHGAGERGAEDGSELDLVASHGFFSQIKEEGKHFPFIMVGPQCPCNEYWGSYLESLNEFLDYIILKNNIDTTHIYLTGLSMGGMATWMWALGNPDRFAAITPVCGQGVNSYAGKLIDMPVRAYHGDIDHIVSVHDSVEMVASINRKGGHATLKIFHGVEHNAWDYAYTDEMVEWLLKY